MIRDVATPWVRHFLNPNSWTCIRCGETLRPGESVYEGEVFQKDGRILIGPPPFRKWNECDSSINT